MGEALRIEVFGGADWASDLRDRWVELQGESETATPFQTWEWHSTWASVFRGKPQILVLYDGDDLVGICPMVKGAVALRPMACGPSDYLHPLVRTGFEAPVWGALMDHFGSENLVDLHQISERFPALKAPDKAASFPNATCLTVTLPHAYETYVGTLSKSLRYDVRRLDRSHFATGDAVIERADAGTLNQALDVFFAQHRKRWKSRGLPGAFMGKSEEFHRRWVAIAEKSGWLRLSTLIYQGKSIGSIYAMTFNDSCYYYQAGFDPEFSSLSPGTLLVAHTIKEAISEGVGTFDFCRGDEPYKRRWQPDGVHVNQRILLGTSRVRERYLKEAWRIEARVRQRLEGGSLFPRRRT